MISGFSRPGGPLEGRMKTFWMCVGVKPDEPEVNKGEFYRKILLRTGDFN